MSGYIIAIANHKGGVGKTTATVTLAHGLHNRANKVLVVDLDHQCNSSSRLLSDYDNRKSLYDLLSESQGADIENCIHPTRWDNVHCLPNNLGMSGLELDLIREDNFFKVKQMLREYTKKRYDYILLDCPPNMLYFFYSALFMADFCLIPVLATSRDGVKGLNNVLHEIAKIQKKENPDLRFLKILINGLDKRMSIHKAIYDHLLESFNQEDIFDTVIPTNTQFSQAEFLGQTILEHAKASPGARAYRNLAAEIMDIVPPAQK